FHPIKYGFHFAKKVSVGEHHAFRIGRSSRGIEQGSKVIGGGRRGLERFWPFVKNLGKIREPSTLRELTRRKLLRHAFRIHKHELYIDMGGRASPQLRMLGVAKKD